MTRIIPRFVCLLLIISIVMDSSAQVDAQRKENLAALKKDTAFKRFQTQLAGIMKTAKGKKTNYAAVKSLFDKNKLILEGLKKRHNLAMSPINVHNPNKYVAIKDRPLVALANTTGMNSNIYNFSRTGPFEAYFIHDDAPIWDTSTSSNTIAFTAHDGSEYKLGPAAFYYNTKIKVPDNPQIVAVRVEFDYSFYATGWDTENGEISAILCFYTDYFFSSPAYQSLPPSNIFERNYDNIPSFFKNAGQLYNKTFNQTDDYVFTREGTFAIEGYVTPGETYYMKLGAGYTEDSKTGTYNAYHYGEFSLKKVTVKYLKAGE